MWSASQLLSVVSWVCPVCLETGVRLPLIPKQLLACPPRQQWTESTDLASVLPKTSGALPLCPQSANGAMIPFFDPPSTTTRCGSLWGQVRCKQIQYTLHCMAPQGSQWSYSRGTNHFGSRFACFFLLYFPKACSTPHPTPRTLPSHPPLPSYTFIYIWTS